MNMLKGLRLGHLLTLVFPVAPGLSLGGQFANELLRARRGQRTDDGYDKDAGHEIRQTGCEEPRPRSMIPACNGAS